MEKLPKLAAPVGAGHWYVTVASDPLHQAAERVQIHGQRGEIEGVKTWTTRFTS